MKILFILSGDLICGTMEDYEMEEPVNSGQRDRLSELPNSLILHILSTLPMRNVVRTTLLSKRWNNLWTTIPCLNFCYFTYVKKEEVERIRNFINRALMLWKGIKILKFKIYIITYLEVSLAIDIDLWVRYAVEHNVEELEIHIHPLENDEYWAPQCLNSCSSIRKLSLAVEGYNLRIHGSPAWNQLTSLQIHDSCFSDCLVNQIMLGAPQLEVFDLRFEENYENLNILSGSLKKLKIEKCCDDVDPTLHTMLRICCPNLETLEVSGVSYSKCLLTNVSSLTDATFGFDDELYNYKPGIDLLREFFRQFLPTIQHVEMVTLSRWCVEVLGNSQKKYPLLPLPNVKFLKFNLDQDNKIRDMMNVLGIFPNLKMLVIHINDWTDECFVENPPEFNADGFLEFGFSKSKEYLLKFDETNLSKSFLGQLKSIEITSHFCNATAYRLIRLLLKHARMLEKLVIRAKDFMSHPQPFLLKVAEVLLSMPRSSPTAKVIFKAS
ncbi:hypothetical protein ACS0TY_016473 [Phlomoides rotata]